MRAVFVYALIASAGLIVASRGGGYAPPFSISLLAASASLLTASMGRVWRVTGRRSNMTSFARSYWWRFIAVSVACYIPNGALWLEVYDPQWYNFISSAASLLLVLPSRSSIERLQRQTPFDVVQSLTLELSYVGGRTRDIEPGHA